MNYQCAHFHPADRKLWRCLRPHGHTGWHDFAPVKGAAKWPERDLREDIACALHDFLQDKTGIYDCADNIMKIIATHNKGIQ